MSPIIIPMGDISALSHESAISFLWQNIQWPSAQHALYAARFNDTNIRWHISKASSPAMAEEIMIRHENNIDADWREKRLPLGEEILRCKCEQHQHVFKVLMSTGERSIIFTSSKDLFWGATESGEGMNNSGKLWMKLREELANKVVNLKKDPSSFWHECLCECHRINQRAGDIVMEHVMPCCSGQCGWCGKYIFGNIEGHVADEHPTCVGLPMPQSFENHLI